MTRKEAILLLLNAKKKANIVEIWAYLIILDAGLKGQLKIGDFSS